MALESVLRERLDKASEELEAIVEAAKHLEPLADEQEGAVTKLTAAAGSLKTISDSLPRAIEALEAASKTLLETMTVVKTADPRPAYNAVAHALKDLKGEQAGVRETVERTAGALRTAVGEIDGKLEQVGQALSGLKADLESSQSMVRRLEQDIQQRLEGQAAAIQGLAAQQTTMRWIGIAAAVFSGVAMVGMVMLLMR